MAGTHQPMSLRIDRSTPFFDWTAAQVYSVITALA